MIYLDLLVSDQLNSKPNQHYHFFLKNLTPRHKFAFIQASFETSVTIHTVVKEQLFAQKC